MIFDRSNLNLNEVKAWERKIENSADVSDRPRIYATAVQSIIKCALVTLSSVTVMVVVDRVIHESTTNFPALSRVRVESNCLDFSEFLKDTNYSSEQMKAALREVLIKLLDVFGSITADILTPKLHDAFKNITSESQIVNPIPRETLVSINSTKKNREQK